jgi:hypothetical protein
MIDRADETWPERHKTHTVVIALAVTGLFGFVLGRAADGGFGDGEIVPLPSPSLESRSQSRSASSTSAGTPPAEIQPNIYRCLSPFYAYAQEELFYPSNHPSVPASTVRPDRCFSSAKDAMAAGFAPAPPPPWWEVVAGIYFMPANPPLIAQCRQAAHEMGFSAPCPSFVPGNEYAVRTCLGDKCVSQMEISGGYFAFGPAGPVAHVYLEITAGRGDSSNEESCRGNRTEETTAILAGRWGQQVVCVEKARAWVSIQRSENGVRYATEAIGHSPTIDELTTKLVELTRFMASRVQLVGAA